ncbi:RBMX2 [Cordylochernes scorpioides]|uniref:RBMX2 n=1 Tax=Cordylochernes scorpioides TaxID=51811 RepID=A0ABY6LQS9_9ARAC|nr:RBMX2 [Cordylochernes scorpioides]
MFYKRELALGIVEDGSASKTSWHNDYKDSAWVYIGGLDYGLTEGDVIAVLSQYGEIVNINLIRDKKTGKSKGFAFICYEDQRSTILAVDNSNGINVCNRTLELTTWQTTKFPKSLKTKMRSPRNFMLKDVHQNYVTNIRG